MKNPDQLEGKVPSMLTPKKYPAGEMSGEIDYREGADVTEQHAAIAREHPEPSLAITTDESLRTFPLWLLILCGIAVFWAGGYLFLFSGAFRADASNERSTQIADFFPKTGEGGPGAGGAVEKTPAQKGEAFFNQTCASCHQKDGKGAAGQYPPLAGSEWVTGNNKRLAGIVLHGLTGPIKIQGQVNSYSGVMQAWGTSLPNDKIAYILTYIRQAWGNSAPPVEPAQIQAARDAFKGHTKSWTMEELMQIPEDDVLPGAAAPAAPAAGEKKTP